MFFIILKNRNNYITLWKCFSAKGIFKNGTREYVSTQMYKIAFSTHWLENKAQFDFPFSFFLISFPSIDRV